MQDGLLPEMGMTAFMYFGEQEQPVLRVRGLQFWDHAKAFSSDLPYLSKELDYTLVREKSHPQEVLDLDLEREGKKPNKSRDNRNLSRGKRTCELDSDYQ